MLQGFNDEWWYQVARLCASVATAGGAVKFFDTPYGPLHIEWSVLTRLANLQVELTSEAATAVMILQELLGSLLLGVNVLDFQETRDTGHGRTREDTGGQRGSELWISPVTVNTVNLWGRFSVSVDLRRENSHWDHEGFASNVQWEFTAVNHWNEGNPLVKVIGHRSSRLTISNLFLQRNLASVSSGMCMRCACGVWCECGVCIIYVYIWIYTCIINIYIYTCIT